MANFTKKTPAKSITINGNQYQMPVCYAGEHVCTENESAALQSLLAENVRNNFASKLNTMNDKNEAFADEAAAQEAFSAYVASYEFGVRRGGGGRVVDPVEREARKIGADRVRAALKGKNIAVPIAAEVNKLVEAHWEKNGAAWLDRAKKVIALRSEEGDSLDIDAVAA